MMKNKKLFYGVIVIILIGLSSFVLYDISYPRQFYGTDISDEEYIKIAKSTLEAQKFLEKYPEAIVEVDRSGKLAVDFRVDMRPIIETDSSLKWIRLRVFIIPKNNMPSEKFIDCNGKVIKSNLLEYLDTENCLGYVFDNANV
jgi:hypothetical protein